MWNKKLQRHSEKMLRRSAEEKLKKAGKRSIKQLKAVSDLQPPFNSEEKARIFEDIRQLKRKAKGKEAFENFTGGLFQS